MRIKTIEPDEQNSSRVRWKLLVIAAFALLLLAAMATWLLPEASDQEAPIISSVWKEAKTTAALVLLTEQHGCKTALPHLAKIYSNKESPPILNLLGVCHARVGDYDAARAVFLLALTHDPLAEPELSNLKSLDNYLVVLEFTTALDLKREPLPPELELSTVVEPLKP
ncbi:MAG: hypothetical protein ACJAX5_002991 [Patiriisocius sp.]|jgi:hypothetical protein